VPDRHRSLGTGSVYYDAAKDRWVAQVYVRDPGSNRCRTARRFFRTKAEAKVAVTALRAEAARAAAERSASASPTLADWCRGWVSGDLPRLPIAPTTKNDYRYALDLVASSPIASVSLADLSPTDVDRLLAWRQSQAPARNSVRLVRAALSRSLADAERRGLIQRNPARLARLSAEAVAPKERRSLTHDQARALEAVLDGEPDEAMWLSMLLLGLRPGEAAGLTWADVDLEQGVLHVAGARKWTPEGFVLGPTKTRRGNRALKMPPRLAAAFARLAPGAPDDLVFPGGFGRVKDPSNMRHRLARLSKRAGIDPPVTPYELRHTAASLLSDSGVPIEVLADLLGHTSTQMLESVYRHRVRKVVDPGVW
jgi:integrase